MLTATTDSPPAAQLPTVTLCTVTCNRPEVLPLLQQCVADQTYPHALMEWVIVDDSDNGKPPFAPDPSLDVKVRYVEVGQRLTLGKKRNLSHEYCQGDIIVYLDDDDYYPPQRVQHAVERLLETGHLVAGCTMLPIFFVDNGQAWVSGPFGPDHATANTFAFRRELLASRRYEDTATHAEEKAFLDGYRIPMAQLEPAKTILCIGHNSNTFDKRKLIMGGQNPRMKKLADLSDAFITTERLTAYARLHRDRRHQTLEVRPSPAPISKAPRPVVGAWYINRDTDRSRRISIETQQSQLPEDVLLQRVSAFTPETAMRRPEYSYLRLLNPLRQAQYCLVLSHLRTLEQFVRHSEASHALVMEDDLDLSSMQHWHFDLNELAAALPADCGVVQLCVIWAAQDRGDETPIQLSQRMQCHPRETGEHSTAAYLIRRQTAAAMVDFFKPEGQGFYHLLRYEDPNLIIADHLLYDHRGLGHGQPTLCLPLFRLGRDDTGLPIKDDGQGRMRQASRQVMQAYLEGSNGLRLADLGLPKQGT